MNNGNQPPINGNYANHQRPSRTLSNPRTFFAPPTSRFLQSIAPDNQQNHPDNRMLSVQAPGAEKLPELIIVNEDADEYFCPARNQVVSGRAVPVRRRDICSLNDPQTSSPVHSPVPRLHVRKPQKQQIDPSEQTVRRGQPARIRCLVPDSTHSQLTWSRSGGAPLPDGARDDGHVGDYECSATDPQVPDRPPQVSDPGRISLQPPIEEAVETPGQSPRSVATPPILTVKRSKEARFHCDANRASPAPDLQQNHSENRLQSSQASAQQETDIRVIESSMTRSRNEPYAPHPFFAPPSPPAKRLRGLTVNPIAGTAPDFQQNISDSSMLSAQIDEMAQSSSVSERERDFYFAKLGRLVAPVPAQPRLPAAARTSVAPRPVTTSARMSNAGGARTTAPARLNAATGKSSAAASQNGSRTAEREAAIAEIAKRKGLVWTLQDQIDERPESSSVFERERDFYFAKFRAIDLLCKQADFAGGQLSTKDVQRILYDESDANSPLPRGDVTVDMTQESTNQHSMDPESDSTTPDQGFMQNHTDSGMQHSGDITDQDPHEPIFEIESSLQPNSGNNDIIIAQDEEEEHHAQVQTQDQSSQHQMNVTQTERSDESGGDNLLDMTHPVMDKTHSIHDQTHSVNNSAGSDLIAQDQANERPFKCDLCPYAGTQKCSLQRHMRTHTGEKPFKCNQCPYAATENGNLIKHMRTHTGEKPYPCQNAGCSFRAADKTTLKKHTLNHTSQKPYKCSVCSYASNTKATLKRHMGTHENV